MQSGGLVNKRKAKNLDKSCRSSVIVLRCGINDFLHFWPVSGCATACKRGIPLQELQGQNAYYCLQTSNSEFGGQGLPTIPCHPDVI